MEKEFVIKTHKLPYHVEKGGIFLKDSAVMAGLGCIGKNNLLLTPEFGPIIRLRAMILEEDINHAEILPTAGTDETGKRIKYCRRCESACPVGRPSKDKSGS